MKKILLSLFVGILAVSTLTSLQQAQAIPMGAAEHSGNYFLGDQDLDRWAVGVYYLDRERDIRTLGRLDRFRTTKGMAYVAYEVIYGMSAYVTVGSGTTELGNFPKRDSHSEYGLGLQFNILDHEIPDPTLMEDRIRINASLQYTQSGGDWFENEIDWEEYYGSLTIGIVNDIEGNKFFIFDNIGFFFGAVYSSLNSSAIAEESAFGYTSGITLRFSEKVSFEFGMESIDDGALFAGIHIGL